MLFSSFDTASTIVVIVSLFVVLDVDFLAFCLTVHRHYRKKLQAKCVEITIWDSDMAVSSEVAIAVALVRSIVCIASAVSLTYPISGICSVFDFIHVYPDQDLHYFRGMHKNNTVSAVAVAAAI